MPSRFQDMLRTQRQNTETSRAGLKWEANEDDQLLSLVSEGTSFADIAKTLQRSEGSIKTRLIVYAISKMEKENLSLNQVCELVNLTETDITEYQDRKKLREEKRQQRTTAYKAAQTSVSNTRSRDNRIVTNAEIYDLLVSLNKTVQQLARR